MSATHHQEDSKSQTAEHPEQGHWLGGVREGYADLGEVQLHYVEAGDGPSLQPLVRHSLHASGIAIMGSTEFYSGVISRPWPTPTTSPRRCSRRCSAAT